MSVKKGERNTEEVDSKTGFFNTYFKMYDDAINLIDNNFGARDSIFVRKMSDKVFDIINDIGTHISIANAIYPKDKDYKKEYEERRTHQEIAIGLCFDLLNKYKIAAKKLKARGNEYVNETKNINHEINCLKKWRTSDNHRFSG